MRVSRLVRDLVSPDAPEAPARRALERACREQANADALKLYPVIFADGSNAQEAIDYFERRYAQLLEDAQRRKANR